MACRLKGNQPPRRTGIAPRRMSELTIMPSAKTLCLSRSHRSSSARGTPKSSAAARRTAAAGVPSCRRKVPTTLSSPAPQMRTWRFCWPADRLALGLVHEPVLRAAAAGRLTASFFRRGATAKMDLLRPKRPVCLPALAAGTGLVSEAKGVFDPPAVFCLAALHEILVEIRHSAM